jgi:hypothetical protein
MDILAVLYYSDDLGPIDDGSRPNCCGALFSELRFMTPASDINESGVPRATGR